MPRASRAQAELHRKQVVDAAAEMLRERGADRLSVPDVMAAVGLTHGGFYRQFASKEALLAEACSAAFDERGEYLISLRDALARDAPAEDDHARPDAVGTDAAGTGTADTEDTVALRQAYLTNYLSGAHRDAPAAGCPTVALASDVARADGSHELRAAYLEGLHRMVAMLERLHPPSDDASTRRREVLVELALIVGAVGLARAAEGDPLSDAILRAAMDQLLPRTG